MALKNNYKNLNAVKGSDTIKKTYTIKMYISPFVLMSKI